MMHAHDLIFRLFFIFLIIGGSHCFIVNDDFTYCDDSRIIDFSSSCITSKPTCIDQVEYLKSFLNFRDYYIRPSGYEKIYHSYNGFIYFTECYKIETVWVHSKSVECTVDLKVNFMDKENTNKTGFLTKAMILRSYSATVECSLTEEYSRFSLAHRSDQLLRHKNHVKKVNLSVASKPFTLFEEKKILSFFEKYKLFFLNNMEFSFIMNIFIFFVMVIIFSSLALFNTKLRNKILDLFIKKIENYNVNLSSNSTESAQVKYETAEETIITIDYMNSKIEELLKLNREECQRLDWKIENIFIKKTSEQPKVDKNNENILKNEEIDLEKLNNKIYTCLELRSFLTKYSLDSKGLKDELIERLMNHLKKIYNI